MNINTLNDSDISNRLISWYESNRRELPWRETSNPYIIWISEIILQQTRVAQGLDYFKRFINRFPNVHALAIAEEDEVLKYWQGLGYYSRARNLHAAAKTIEDKFQGIFPESFEDIKSLKGIGDYSNSSIRASRASNLSNISISSLFSLLSLFVSNSSSTLSAMK